MRPNKIILVLILLPILAVSRYSIVMRESGVMLVDRGFLGPGPILMITRGKIPDSVTGPMADSGRPFFGELEKWCRQECGLRRAKVSQRVKDIITRSGSEMTVKIGSLSDVMRDLQVKEKMETCPSGGTYFFLGPEGWKIKCTLHEKGE